MAIFRGFVQSLQVRGDGWVEAVIQAVHGGNSVQTFFIRDLDGDLNTAHRRLGHLSLLRDSVARVLPVEVEYRVDANQGNIIEDLSIHPRPSIDGRVGGRRVEGVVIGLGIAEFGPLIPSSPYRDAPDLASVSILEDDGTVEGFTVDLQRPDPMTGHGMLALLSQAHRTRRPVAVLVADTERTGRTDMSIKAAGQAGQQARPVVVACEWIVVPQDSLDYQFAYVERLGQRYESYEFGEAPMLSHVRVVYTTTPGQTPEGDISDNGYFNPQRLEAWVHDDSPLLARLEAALRDRLQVKLGLLRDQVHEVEMIAGLGSVAKPIWLRVKQCMLPPEPPACDCENLPTIRTPTTSDFDKLGIRISWRGEAWFEKGIWRFVIVSDATAELLIDGKNPCCEEGALKKSDVVPWQCHVFLCGSHSVELILSGLKCSDPFQLRVYRIR